MCCTVRTSIPCDPGAVRTARGWVREQLAALYPDLEGDVVDDAGLTVSEFVTNCVRADAHELSVALTVHRNEIVIATTDDAPGLPHQQAPPEASPTGRGLQIVAALTTEWGVSPSDGHKTVWGRFDVAESAAATFHCTI